MDPANPLYEDSLAVVDTLLAVADTLSNCNGPPEVTGFEMAISFIAAAAAAVAASFLVWLLFD